MSLFKLRDSRGDTIVEVLIAITVITAVLGGAYSSANRSLIGSRQSQERGEALKLVEGQLEKLKSISITASTPAPGTAFCLNDTNTIVTAPCTSPTGVPYKLSIMRNTDTFTLTATWEQAGGGGNQNLKIVYRAYP